MLAQTLPLPASVAQCSRAASSQRPSAAHAAVYSSQQAQRGTKLAGTATSATAGAARRAHLQVPLCVPLLHA